MYETIHNETQLLKTLKQETTTKEEPPIFEKKQVIKNGSLFYRQVFVTSFRVRNRSLLLECVIHCMVYNTFDL